MPEVYSANKKKTKTKKGEEKNDDRVVEEVLKLRDEGMGRSFWQSLMAYPKKVKFESQNNKEMILLMARKHLITNLGWLSLVLFLGFVPLFWGEFPLIYYVGAEVKFGLLVLWYLGIFLFAFQRTILWFYNIYIVTDERVVDVDFFGLLYKNVNVTQIRLVEDVNYSQIGLLAGMFNFGDVVIQTASEQLSDDLGKEQAAFTFQAVPNPDRVARVLTQLMEQEEQESYEGRVR